MVEFDNKFFNQWAREGLFCSLTIFLKHTFKSKHSMANENLNLPCPQGGGSFKIDYVDTSLEHSSPDGEPIIEVHVRPCVKQKQCPLKRCVHPLRHVLPIIDAIEEFGDQID